MDRQTALLSPFPFLSAPRGRGPPVPAASMSRTRRGQASSERPICLSQIQMRTQRRCLADGFWRAQPLGLSAALPHVLGWVGGSGNCDGQEANRNNAGVPFPDFINMSDVGVRWERRSAPAAALPRGREADSGQGQAAHRRKHTGPLTHSCARSCIYLTDALHSLTIYGGGRVGHRCSNCSADSPEFPGSVIQQIAVETYYVSGTVLGAEIQVVSVEFNFYWERGQN